MTKAFYQSHGGDYALLDCGNRSRLERFGTVVVARSAPVATWRKGLRESLWASADLCTAAGRGWLPEAFPAWNCRIGPLCMRLQGGGQGQLGLFPEQLPNWVWLERLAAESDRPLRILNAFAYTGASTLAVSTPRHEVVHLDGAKASVRWARDNASLNGKDQNTIRWIVDDAMTFLAREIRRKCRYDGLILDPPAFGQGKGRRHWKLERDLPALLECCKCLLSEKPAFVLLSCHVRDWSPEDVAAQLGQGLGLTGTAMECLNLTIPAETEGRDLPMGVCARLKFDD